MSTFPYEPKAEERNERFVESFVRREDAEAACDLIVEQVMPRGRRPDIQPDGERFAVFISAADLRYSREAALVCSCVRRLT